MRTPFCLRPQGREGPSDDDIIVDRSPFLIGRHNDNDATLRSEGISSWHAKLHLEGESLCITDQGSRNGTFVNGERLAAGAVTPLALGDTVFLASNTYVLCSAPQIPAMGATVPLPRDMIQKLAELLHVVDHGTMVPHFQPIIDLKDGRTVAWEALGRGRYGGRELSPGPLFGLAETRAVADKLSVLSRERAMQCVACGHCWNNDRRMQLFINLHPDEIRADGRMAELKTFAASPAASAFQIVFEISESLACRADEMRRIVGELRELGYAVAYDDFGRGQSRVADLMNVPPDFLKLDRALVQNVDSEPVKQGLVRAFIDACEQLDVTSLGEGVETEAEKATLIELGVRLGQGYLFRKPAPAFELFGLGFASLPDDCVFRHTGPEPRPTGS